jgi:succinate dehydrogenase/fumarate reductase flavoprotein subunit
MEFGVQAVETLGVTPVYKWSSDNTEEIKKGWIMKADTIGELATKIGMNPKTLEETVSTYNRNCALGTDPFGKPKEWLVTIDSPPYYAIKQFPGGPNTQGGAERNVRCQILDTNDNPIPRLYSAGEFGSFYGFLYEGGGNIAECLATGRIAGRNAAAEKPWE